MTTNGSALILPPPAPAQSATNDLRDIRPPVDIPTGWAWLGWTLAALAMAALLYFGWRWWQRRKARLVKSEIIIPPHERARRKLQTAMDHLDDPKLYCTLVSDALRLYLEERFQLQAPERTTEEFLTELKHTTALNVTQKQTLGDFLNRCDLVKFARLEPPETDLVELQKIALRLISETEPPLLDPHAVVPPPQPPPVLPPPLPPHGAHQPAILAANETRNP